MSRPFNTYQVGVENFLTILAFEVSLASGFTIKNVNAMHFKATFRKKVHVAFITYKGCVNGLTACVDSTVYGIKTKLL